MPKSKPNPMTEAMYYVLLALQTPLHGYGLMERITEISRNRVRMGPGTLYGVLTRLQKEKLIELAEDDGRRKTYRRTAEGLVALLTEHERLVAMVEDGNNQIIGGGGCE